MRKIRVLLAFIAIIFAVQITGWASAKDGKDNRPHGQPFQYLQQQIDELKEQIKAIKLTPGPPGPPGPAGQKGDKGDPGVPGPVWDKLSVYDANDQFVGTISLSMIAMGFHDRIYVPSVDKFISISYSTGDNIKNLDFISFDAANCGGQGYYPFNNFDLEIADFIWTFRRSENDYRHYTVVYQNLTLYPPPSIWMAYPHEPLACTGWGVGWEQVQGNLHPITEITLPFSLPLALPLRFEPQ